MRFAKGFGQRVRDERTGATKIVSAEEMPAFLAANQQTLDKRDKTEQGLVDAWQQSAQIQQNLLKQKAAEEAQKRAEQLKRSELDASINDRDVKNRLAYNSQRIQEQSNLRRDNLQRGSMQDAMTRFAQEMDLKNRGQAQSYQNSRDQLRLQKRSQDNSMFNAEAGRELSREQMEQSAAQFADKMGLDYQRLSLDQQQFLMNQAQQNEQFNATNARAYDQMGQQQGQFDATMQQRTAEQLGRMDLDWARFDADGDYRQQSLAQAAELAMIRNDESSRQFDATMGERVQSRLQGADEFNRVQSLRENESNMSMSEVAASRQRKIQELLSIGGNANLTPAGKKTIQKYRNMLGGMLKHGAQLRPQARAEMLQNILDKLQNEYLEGEQQPLVTSQALSESNVVRHPELGIYGDFDPNTGRTNWMSSGGKEAGAAAASDPFGNFMQVDPAQQVVTEMAEDPKLWRDALQQAEKELIALAPIGEDGNVTPPSRSQVIERARQGIDEEIEMRREMQRRLTPPDTRGTEMGRRMADPAVRQRFKELEAQAFGNKPAEMPATPEQVFNELGGEATMAGQAAMSPEAQAWQPPQQRQQTAPDVQAGINQETSRQIEEPLVGMVQQLMGEDFDAAGSIQQHLQEMKETPDKTRLHVLEAPDKVIDVWKNNGAQVIPNIRFERGEIDDGTFAQLPPLWVDEKGEIKLKQNMLDYLKSKQRGQQWEKELKNLPKKTPNFQGVK